MVSVARDVTVVDLVCDQHGVPLAEQRACRRPGHINALKLPGGGYWGIVVADARGRDLAENPDQRGRRISVRGAYYPAIHAIAVSSVQDLQTAELGPFPPGLDDLATLPDERRRGARAARGDA